MKLTLFPMLILTSAYLSGCATTNGSYCQISEIIRPDVTDTLTIETKRQILANNEKIAKICGVK